MISNSSIPVVYRFAKLIIKKQIGLAKKKDYGKNAYLYSQKIYSKKAENAFG